MFNHACQIRETEQILSSLQIAQVPQEGEEEMPELESDQGVSREL
jgi:hypothetical protein